MFSNADASIGVSTVSLWLDMGWGTEQHIEGLRTIPKAEVSQNIESNFN